MMLRRTARRGVAGILLGALLFAQAVIAMAACEQPRVTPVQAFATKATEPSCHEAPAQNANLCLAHCLSADQSADTPQVVVPVWIGAAPLAVAVVDRRSGRAAMLRHVPPPPAGPPPRILFQSFLI